MELLSVFSIIKYGAKIFLAVMGFISFDDINVKPVRNNSEFQNVNYVESIPFAEQNHSEGLLYSDSSYFFSKENNPDILFAAHNDVFKSETNCKFDNQFKNNYSTPEKIILFNNDNRKDLEFIFLNEIDKTEIEYSIKVIEDISSFQKVAVSLKTIHISNSFTTN